MKGHGGLLATEHTSLYTPWRNRRRDFGLADLFAVGRPTFVPWPWQPDAILEIEPVRRELGKGRVVYLPEVKPTVEKPAGAPMTSQYWHLPVNWQELVDAVVWAGEGDPLLQVEAPLTVTAELLRQENEGRLLLHLVNYGAEKNPSVTNVKVRLALRGKEARKVFTLTPDGGEIPSLEFQTDNSRISFTVPTLQIYTLVVVEL